jgi:hypothetical protein
LRHLFALPIGEVRQRRILPAPLPVALVDRRED